MPLHPQDVVVVLKLVANRNATKRWSYADLGKDLFMSGSQVFRSVARAEASRLLSAPSVPSTPEMREALPITWMFPNNSNLKEFRIHGVKYSFPVERAGPTRGTPTAEAAPPLNPILAQDFPLPPRMAKPGRSRSRHRLFAALQERPAGCVARPSAVRTPCPGGCHSRRARPRTGNCDPRVDCEN